MKKLLKFALVIYISTITAIHSESDNNNNSIKEIHNSQNAQFTNNKNDKHKNITTKNNCIHSTNNSMQMRSSLDVLQSFIHKVGSPFSIVKENAANKFSLEEIKSIEQIKNHKTQHKNPKKILTLFIHGYMSYPQHMYDTYVKKIIDVIQKNKRDERLIILPRAPIQFLTSKNKRTWYSIFNCAPLSDAGRKTAGVQNAIKYLESIIKALDDIYEFDQIEIFGHSMGGMMASLCMFMDKSITSKIKLLYLNSTTAMFPKNYLSNLPADTIILRSHGTRDMAIHAHTFKALNDRKTKKILKKYHLNLSSINTRYGHSNDFGVYLFASAINGIEYVMQYLTPLSSIFNNTNDNVCKIINKLQECNEKKKIELLHEDLKKEINNFNNNETVQTTKIIKIITDIMYYVKNIAIKSNTKCNTEEYTNKDKKVAHMPTKSQFRNDYIKLNNLLFQLSLYSQTNTDNATITKEIINNIKENVQCIINADNNTTLNTSEIYSKLAKLEADVGKIYYINDPETICKFIDQSELTSAQLLYILSPYIINDNKKIKKYMKEYVLQIHNLQRFLDTARNETKNMYYDQYIIDENNNIPENTQNNTCNTYSNTNTQNLIQRTKHDQYSNSVTS